MVAQYPQTNLLMRQTTPSALVGATLLVCVPLTTVPAHLHYVHPNTSRTQLTSTNSSLDHRFTYSIVQTIASPTGLIDSINAAINSILIDAGGTLYAIWTPTEKPETAPFEGLGESQLALMFAWSDQNPPLSMLDSTLAGLDGISEVKTDVLVPIYLAEGLTVPTGAGFYVHREEIYQPRDVDEVVRLSTEAWDTWESTFGTRVTGLFRRSGNPGNVARLLRIVWYRSYDGWVDSRNAERDLEARRRFAARRLLQLEGSGIAIATNRVVR